jgi:uncharacterized protein DUF4177
MGWEYKIVFVFSEVADEDEFEKRLHDSVHTLNNLGDDGWELVGLLPHLTTASLKKYHALFKREKS